MKKKFVKKLNEDDVLEILIEYFQRGKQKNAGHARFFGSAGQDLRVVIVLSDDEDEDFDLEEIERKTDFNGDHSFLNNHPEFDLSKH